MEMRIVLAVGRAHRRDLLAARDPLTAANEHFLEVAVERVDIFHVAAIAISVPDDDDVSPAQMNIASKNHDAVAGGVDRIAEIGVAAANSVPIFADVTAGPEPTRLVVTFRVWLTDGKIEPVCDLGERAIERGAHSRNDLRRLFLRRH